MFMSIAGRRSVIAVPGSLVIGSTRRAKRGRGAAIKTGSVSGCTHYLNSRAVRRVSNHEGFGHV